MKQEINPEELVDEDVNQLNKEQIKALKSYIKKRIEEVKEEVDYNNAMQLALKLILNGSYGAFASKYFICADLNIASTITAMGRDIIKYMDKVNEEYWYQKWHVDYELHEKLGISGKVKKIDDTWIHSNTPRKGYTPFEELDTENEFYPTEDDIFGDVVKETPNTVTRKVPVSIYIDTDSVFVGFQPAMDSCNWQGDKMDFVKKVNQYRLESYFHEKLEEYAQMYGVENVQSFELEKINSSILFHEKKRYIQNITNEEGIDYEPLSYIFPKGVELIRSDTPPFARQKVMEIIKYLLNNPESYNSRELNKKVRDIKNLFKIANIEDISINKTCNNYEKFIMDDTQFLKTKSGTPFHVKAAAFHNYLLNQNSNYKSYYNTIKSGNKVKIYYCKSKTNNAFAFLRGSYPKEFAPPLDVDTQFEKTVLNVINNIIEVLGLPKLNSRLSLRVSLF